MLAGQQNPLAGNVEVSDIEYTVSVSDFYNEMVLNEHRERTRLKMPCKCTAKIKLTDKDWEPLLIAMTPTLRRGDVMMGEIAVSLGDAKPFAWTKTMERRKRNAFILHRGKPGKHEHWQLEATEKAIIHKGEYLLEIWADVVHRPDESVHQAGGVPQWQPAFLPPPYTYQHMHCTFTLKDSGGKVITSPTIEGVDKCAIDVNFGTVAGHQLYWQMTPLILGGSISEIFKEAFEKPGYTGMPVNTWTQTAKSGEKQLFVVTQDPDKVRPIPPGEEVQLKPGEYLVEVQVTL